MKRTRYFLPLLWLGLRSVISFFLTLAFLASLALVWQAPKIERNVTKFLETTPEQRGERLAKLLEKNALVENASVQAVEYNTQKKVLLLKNIAIQLSSKIAISCKSTSINWLEQAKPILAILPPLLPQSVRLDGLRLVITLDAQKLFVDDTHTSVQQANEKTESSSLPAQKTEWQPLARMVGFFASIISERRIALNDSIVVLRREKQNRAFLRLRFDKLSLESYNGLTWSGVGSASGEKGEKLRVALQGNYAPLTARLYQSLRIDDLSPQKALQVLLLSANEKSTTLKNTLVNTSAQSEQTKAWLVRKGDLTVDYNHDLDEQKKWLRLRFGKNSQPYALAFDYSYDPRLGDLANSNLTFNDLPLNFVWGAAEALLPSHLAQDTLPFELSAQAFGNINMQQSSATDPKQRFDGAVRLANPSLRWRGEKSIVRLHQLNLVIKGSEKIMQIDTSIDLHEETSAGIDKKIELIPQLLNSDEERNSNPEVESNSNPISNLAAGQSDEGKLSMAKMQIKINGKSRGNIPAETVLGLWPPNFKTGARSTVVDVLRGGQVKDLTIALDASVDLLAKKSSLNKLDGNFRLQDGRLRIFADPITITEVESVARFAKNSITFKIKNGHYRQDFLLTGGEVSFDRQKIPNGKKSTLLRASIDGNGQAEALRFLIQQAPFLQELTFLQQIARALPPAPSAIGNGHFNLRAFTKQLSGVTNDIIFPQPLSYDTAWKFKKVSFQAPLWRFYEGDVNVASTSSQPIDLSLSMNSARGMRLRASWQKDIPDTNNAQGWKQNLESENIKLNGMLDAKALSSDFAYLPSEWFAEDIPLLFTYQKQIAEPARGLLSFGAKPNLFRIESENLERGQGMRIFGGSAEGQAREKIWTIDGNYKQLGYSNLLLRQQRVKAREQNKDPEDLLTILLQNDSRPVRQDASTNDVGAPEVWRMLMRGQNLDLSRWVDEKPWQNLQNSSNRDEEELPSLGLRSQINLDLDIRLKRLQLYKMVKDRENESNKDDGNKKKSTPTESNKEKNNPPYDVSSSSDILENVQGNLIWRGGLLQKATFSNNGEAFALADKNKKRKKQKTSTKLLYDLREGKELLSLESDDLGSFLHQSRGVSFAEGGKTRVSFVRTHKPNQRPKPRFIGYGKVDDLSLYDMPTLFKILNSIGIVTAFNKGVKRLHVSSDLTLWDGVLSLDNFKLANNLTALTAKGSIDIDEEKLDLRGEVASLPIISNFLRNIPIIGYVLVGRKKDNLFAFSYDAKGDWNNPNVTASPFNLLLPGIAKVANPLQLLERDEIKKTQQLKRDEIAKQESERKKEAEKN